MTLLFRRKEAESQKESVCFDSLVFCFLFCFVFFVKKKKFFLLSQTMLPGIPCMHVSVPKVYILSLKPEISENQKEN